METENARIRIAKKIYSPPKDTPKKKRQNKNNDTSLAAAATDITEQKIPEPEPSTNPQLVQYIFKLKHQLSETKKKLKYEKNKFKHLISSVSSHFDDDGQSFFETIDCGNLFQDTEDHAEHDSTFEKFFTTHRYIISDKKNEHPVEEEHKNEQKPKVRASKPKAPSAVIKLNLKDIEGEGEKEPTKKSKKKKASSPIEEEKETKKKRIKKNTPAGTEENSLSKGGDLSMPVVIPPMEKETVSRDDKVLQAEETIHRYEELAHANPGHGAMHNNMMDDGIKYLMQQAKVDPNMLNQLNQQMMMGNLGYNQLLQGSDPVEQAKIVQELLKQGMQDPIMMGMNPSQDLLNYYQRAFQS